jgi:putative spermidine/putrescine transport system ATP-binding protein
MSTGAAVVLNGVGRTYGNVVALRDVSLSVEAGQFLTLLGSSGSGKTTLLRILAGFIDATSGSVLLDGSDLLGLPVHKRNIGMVFQNYALFPHMSVEQNVAFPLKMRGFSRERRKSLVGDALRLVELPDFARRRPNQLSGGQQQRVALARAIVAKPRLLLMDEPLGALDRRLRESMQIEIRRISTELGLTVINVTHDQEEALCMSDRIALLAHGDLIQFGRPAELYQRPSSHLVAAFMGESNLFSGTVRKRNGSPVLQTKSGDFQLPRAVAPEVTEATMMVRPAAIRVTRLDRARAGRDDRSVEGIVLASLFIGDEVKLVVRLADGPEILARCAVESSAIFGIGEAVRLEWDPDSVHVMA